MSNAIVQPTGYAGLATQTTPQSGTATDQQAWMFYDTQLITSGTTTQLTFFTVANADKTMSNWLGASALPSPQFFSIYSFGFDIFFKPQVGATLGALLDAYELLFNQRAIWTFTLSDKKVGPFPVRAAHASGGPVGGLGVATTATTTTDIATYANNGTFDGGFVIDNAIVLPPQTGFEFTVALAAAPTLTANMNISAWMYGTLFRKVV